MFSRLISTRFPKPNFFAPPQKHAAHLVNQGGLHPQPPIRLIPLWERTEK